LQKPHVRMLLFTAMFLLAFVSVTTAFAAQPSKDTIVHNEGFYKMKCDGFTGTVADSQDGTVTVFFDNAGNPIKMTAHIDETRTLTNLKTGYTLQAPGHFTNTVYLQTGTVTQVGVVFQITIPGQGTVGLDAGKLIVDAAGNVTFMAGPKQVFNGQDAVLCAAIS
jgi:pectate lyase